MLRVSAMESFELRSRLENFEFIRLHCTLSCEQQGEVRMADLLGLRADVIQVARDMVSLGALDSKMFSDLFDPQAANDPESRRRFQKPAPPFVFRYLPEGFRVYHPGEDFRFELLLMGASLSHVDFFIRLVEVLAGKAFGGEGCFELTEVRGLDDSENDHPVWLQGDDFDELMPPVCSAGWWAMRHEDFIEPLQLEIVTPARLLTRGRPLFRPQFIDLLPFLLRRVTSLCYAHAGLTLFEDVAPVLEAGREVACSCNLNWEDWRASVPGSSIDLGGLIGSCELRGPGVRKLSGLLAMAELFQVGRGAAYGAGKIELHASLPG